ncbi:MAG: hypothetical protein CM15mP125_0610 [Gammaproteobacteria bacterium]|nr:MAG: hypothetical protein CM15mP125_0610 [Gammaproteobacteria bacterium]
MQDFYGDGSGWNDEQLVDTDVSPITWRKLASRCNGASRLGVGVTGSVKASSLRLRDVSEARHPDTL